MFRLARQRAALAASERVTAARVARVAPRYFHSSRNVEALSKFTMPAMSPTMTEGGLSSWKVQEGASFSAGDVILDIETDKATMDVEAQDDGVMAKIIVGDGSKGVKVGSTIAILAEEGDEISAAEIEKLMSESDSAPKEEAPKEEAPKKSEEKAKEETKKSEPSTSSSGPSKPSVELSTDKAILATPLAKRLALEKGVPLAQLKGTGPEGRIVKADVENYKAPAAASAPAASSAPAEQTGAYTDTPVSNMRRTIAQRLTQSKTEAPNYYVTVEVQMDRVNKLRELFNKAGSASSSGGVSEGVKSGVKLSVNDFIIKAAALALQDVSEVNSGWHGDFIRSYHKQDISMAVATPNGLITPIITDCGAKGLSAISTQSKELAKKARDGKLKPEEYQGGSFCISNLGMMGVHSFTAIINPPQSCILAIGASEKKLVMDATSEKGFKEVSVMKATISADHRVVDGARAAAWMQAFKQYLESPLSFML